MLNSLDLRAVPNGARRLLFALLALLALAIVRPAEAAPCSADCLAPGDYDLSMNWGGLTRTYKVHVPASYTGNASVALLVDLHGGATTAATQRSISGQLAQSDLRGFIAVWPQGSDGSWNANGCCMLAHHFGVDDVGFLRAMIAAIKTRANIHSDKVYATGLSNGGGMAHRLACDAADVVRAAAPASNPLQMEACHPERPVTVIAFAGTADTQVPYDGGPLIYPSVTVGVPLGWQGARASLAAWKGISGCSSTVTRTQLAGGSRDETYANCVGGVKAGLVTIADGHHDLYNGDLLHQIMYAHPNYAVDISDYMWENIFVS